MSIFEEIKKERGEYTRKRRKKFLRLKNTKGLNQYYLQKRGLKISKPKVEIKLNWFEKIILFIKRLFLRMA